MNDNKWTEVYRPKFFAEVAGFDTQVGKITKQLQKDKSSFPHILFSGPAGLGKTTLGRLIAKELLGEYYSEDFKILNASDERGIETVRTKIGDYTKYGSLGGGLKVILLDECDEMTKPAQQALRSMMENAKHVKFVLCCNDLKKMSEPIKSRCVVFKLEKPDREKILTRLEWIVVNEQLQITSPKDTLRALISECYPDIRMMINTLQMLANDQPIDKEKIKSLKLKFLQSTISKCFDAIMDMNEDRAMLHMKELLDSPDFNYRGLLRYFMFVFQRLRRPQLIPILAYYDRSIIYGSDMVIQMYALVLDLIAQRKKLKGMSNIDPFDGWKDEKVHDAMTLDDSWIV